MSNLLMIFCLFRQIGFAFLIIVISGCYTINTKMSEYNAIGNNPYQYVGNYETTNAKKVSRLILNRKRVKKINKDRYYIEIIIEQK